MSDTASVANPGHSTLRVFTIGHSDHSAEEFVALLQQHCVELVVDVRSQPYSQWVPQFNRENLIRTLTAAQVRYRFLGDALGGRPSNRELYDPGRETVNYERLSSSVEYAQGIDELVRIARECAGNVAVLCSEGDHRKCHRGRLIAPTLLRRGVRVTHIQPDGSTVEAELEPQQLTLL